MTFFKIYAFGSCFTETYTNAFMHLGPVSQKRIQMHLCIWVDNTRNRLIRGRTGWKDTIRDTK